MKLLKTTVWCNSARPLLNKELKTQRNSKEWIQRKEKEAVFSLAKNHINKGSQALVQHQTPEVNERPVSYTHKQQENALPVVS